MAKIEDDESSISINPLQADILTEEQKNAHTYGLRVWNGRLHKAISLLNKLILMIPDISRSTLYGAIQSGI